MTLSYAGFIQACHVLYTAWLNLQHETDWSEVRILEANETNYLRITKTVQPKSNRPPTSLEPEPEFHEEDPETLPLQHPPGPPTTRVAYDIIYSPIFQEPVLYIAFPQSPSTTSPPSLDEVYDLLVPPALTSQLRHPGVVGALSMVDHPVTGMPLYFVHPCRTAEAVAAISQGEGMDPVEYLMMWLGLVGGSVGLSVPVDFARVLRSGESESAHRSR